MAFIALLWMMQGRDGWDGWVNCTAYDTGRAWFADSTFLEAGGLAGWLATATAATTTAWTVGVVV
ncbi:hypothetical protein CERZMDRAFT_91218 [Cercospora zeae-maydis SCOH1-5]|uniref:Uncharacterized protein n=1 Tax=Cercospora zeae-maydis SCOH1-5 TaxID=717836 RepID=A0A6A6F9H4_9PEZI|nr:hypothetical protein CERZMDRAFT_91218 [Cercospora zeae-maydis SCOH1-5]